MLNGGVMKISYKNTALAFLDDPDKMKFGLPEAHVPMTEGEKLRFGHSVRESFKTVAPAFKSNIRFVAIPFIDAYFKARHKLKDVFDKVPMDEVGTFIWVNNGYTFTNFYYLKTFGEGEDWHYTMTFIQFTKLNKVQEEPNLDVMCLDTTDTSKTFIWKGHFDQGFDHGYYSAFLVSFLCFIKHVEIETKFVNGGGKVHHAGEKYVNDTKHKIEILDSTWFTTIVRSEGFMVGDETGGFFRLQPCGKDLADRKLIWVEPFQKQGYTRKAKISTQ
jgi:hypothetical protein